MALFISGGVLDPNLDLLVVACRKLGIPSLEVRHGPGVSPAFHWDLHSHIDFGVNQSCRPTAAFVRHDVFEGLRDTRSQIAGRAYAWYQAIHGWVLSQPEIRVFNRSHTPAAGNKPATLILAKRCGLSVPDTVLTNCEVTIREAASKKQVTKPVAGGDYCYTVEEVLSRTEFRHGKTSCPAFLQTRLLQPEVRIYIIGKRVFAFEMRSSSLDYRVHQDADVIPLSEIPPVVGPLRSLMQVLQMDYGAADFKTDPLTGELVFLEMNTSPMFAAFDLKTNGELCVAMVQEVMQLSNSY